MTADTNCIGFDYTLQIINCYNLGSVGTGDFTAGIVGYSNSAGNSLLVINCYNSGVLKDKNRTGGIVSSWNSDRMYLSYCYNLVSLSNGYGIMASGNTGNAISANYCYYVSYKRFKNSPTTETNPGTIDSLQNLTPGVTINGQTHTTLVSALNA